MKTKIRNKLSVETVNGSLLATQLIQKHGSCVKFKPPTEMWSRLNINMYKITNIAASTSTTAVNDSDSD